mgnify:CR=1 FL=1
MSLFSAIFPPDDVVDELHDALLPVRRAHPRLRWQHPARWHVTVRFFGEAEPADQLAGLDRVTAPVLRLRGSGTFRQVLWIGVDGALAELGDIWGNAGTRPFVTHVSEEGISVGYTDRTFRPNQSVTRGEFAAFLYRLAAPSGTLS